MKVEIITPENILYKGEVTSVAVPSIDGEFQMLNNHAPIVSLLTAGNVKLYGNIQPKENVASQFKKGNKPNEFLLYINGGTLEFNNNKAVILAE